MSWLDAYFANQMQAAGVPQQSRGVTNFGPGFAIADNGSTLTITPTLGGAPIDQTVPMGGLSGSTQLTYNTGSGTWKLTNPA